MARQRRKLGQILLRWEIINQQQLEESLKVAEGAGRKIGETLVELGHCSQDDVAKALAVQFDMEYIDLDAQNAVATDFDLLPADIIQKFHVLPLERNDGKLKVLLHDPMDLELLDVLRFRMNCEIETAVGAESKIREHISRMLSDSSNSIDQAVRELSIDRDAERLDDEEAAAERAEDANAPIVRLVNKIIAEAVNTRASDIHVEPMADRVRLRYRVDGVCHERDNIPKRMQSAMIARLKIMSTMNIAERRVPQDGRIKLNVSGVPIDFRVSACPAYHGESMVMRILRPDSVRIGLASLGFQPDHLDMFSRTIRRPNGIFLVTGPTGSGKTTTLYSALDTLNRPDRKIITAEDPVEYNFSGINQCQVREDIGFTFAAILRTMLRQAPNIILVGEIRDQEVGEVAIQAALTGHLVFSTLHTNDAPSAITRLIDMGIKPFLVASSLQAIMAQRLVRVLCEECKTPDDDPNPYFLRLIGITDEDTQAGQIMRPVGCANCAETGYRGRKGVFEFMQMNTELRDLAFKRAATNQVRRAAITSGMRTLAEDGRLKVLAGITSAEEVARNAQVEGLIDVDQEDM